MKLNEYQHASAWTGPQMAQRTDWQVTLTEQDIAELEAALALVKQRGLAIPDIRKEDFPLPTLSRKLDAVRREIEEGTGFVLLRRLPVERYARADAAILYWGLGAHFGPAFAQNTQGDMLGHVRDLGTDFNTDMRARGYQSRLHLPFHTDSTDIVGLLCLAKARHGGTSRIVSSTAIYNEFVRRRPDLCEVMSQPFCADRRGEETEGQKPYYMKPSFNRHNGRVFVWYSRSYIESAQRFADVPRLTPAQIEALDLMDALCHDPALYLDMELEPGDMQFICNYTVLHSRSDYEDWPEPERKRHLLRLWLRTPAFTDLPPAFADRNADMIAWQRQPRPPVFDLSEIDAALEH